MQRKRSSDLEYDYSPVGYARRRAIRTLDDYGCSTAEIMAMFGVSKATFHRYDLDVRLARRPPRTASRPTMNPRDAREIVIIALIREGYAVAVIAEALGMSAATVYRERTLFHNRVGEASQAEKRNIHRHLKHYIRDTRPWHQKKIDARRRTRRWRRGVSRSS